MRRARRWIRPSGSSVIKSRPFTFPPPASGDGERTRLGSGRRRHPCGTSPDAGRSGGREHRRRSHGSLRQVGPERLAVGRTLGRCRTLHAGPRNRCRRLSQERSSPSWPADWTRVPSADAGRAAEGSEPSGAEGTRTLRVDAARVDALVSLVDELVVARNALGHLAARAEAGEDNAHARAGRSARPTQISGASRPPCTEARSRSGSRPCRKVFRRFARPVREAARGLGKEVDPRPRR